jgi:hypothetical protein
MTEPATDEEIARLEADVASGAMIFEIRNHEMERILSRIRQEQEVRHEAEEHNKAYVTDLEIAENRIKTMRVKTVIKCAEIVRTWAQDNETVQPSYTSMTAAILALLDKKL